MKDKDIYSRFKRVFESTYTIGLCQDNDIEDVVSFIDTYWKKNHSLVKSRQLMDWQYRNSNNNSYNFVIARNKKSGEIHALEGFIPTTQFDPEIESPMTWGAIWKSIPNVAPPGLGLVVKQYREHEFDTPYYCEIGISVDANNYNIESKNTIFKLNNWYMVNNDISTYNLIDGIDHDPSKIIKSVNDVGFIELNRNNWDEFSDNLQIPVYKSKKYYLNRYFNHPIYQYHGLGLINNQTIKREVVIYRIVRYKDSCCIFFVDFIGDGSVLCDSEAILHDLMRNNNAEYILFPNYGIDDCYLGAAGFENREKSGAIIPLYYEPFLKENVDIICASRKAKIDWCSFKGDADQDRPNIIE